MTTEEMMKQVTNRDISHFGEERIKKIYDSWVKGIKNSEKQGWILVGEVEWGEHFPFGKYKEEEAYFLFMRSRLSSNEETYYEYSFGKTFTNPTAECWYFEYKKRYSINTILTSFISRDLQFQGLGNPTLNSEYLKIRLIGSKEWLYPNIDFLNKKIDMDELEKKFRSSKPQFNLF